MRQRLVLSVAGLVLISFLQGCSHTANQEYVAPLQTIKPAFRAQRQWVTVAGSGTSKQYFKLTPASYGDRIYTASYEGTVAAINRLNGRRLWRSKTGQHISSGVTANSELIVVGSHEGQVIAIQPDNGKIIWQTTLAHEILATPCLTTRQVFVKVTNGDLYALDVQTGKIMWNFQERIPSMVLHGSSAPSVSGHFVVAGFADGQLGVFDTRDGHLMWKRPVAIPHGATLSERMVDIDDDPRIVDDVIYVATYQGEIAALRLSTGRLLWHKELSSYSGLVVDQQYVYVADATSVVWAFDRHNGKIVWKQNQLTGRKISAPALTENAIVVGDSEGYLHWLAREDGHFLSRVQADINRIIIPPIVINRSLYLYTSVGDLLMYKEIS